MIFTPISHLISEAPHFLHVDEDTGPNNATDRLWDPSCLRAQIHKLSHRHIRQSGTN